MNTRIARLACLSFASVCLTGIAADDETSAASMKQFLQQHPQAIALIAIQDGKLDTTHWDQFKAKVDGDQVRIPGGVPRTKEEFGDFRLAFEFRLEPGANSGVFLRAADQGKGQDSMCELQILDNTAKEYAELDPRQYHGSAYGLIAAKQGALKPVGEWNYQEVTVCGHCITVKLNGTTILDGDLSKVETSKSGKLPPNRLRTRGRIALGGHAQGVWLRSMCIVPLD